MNSFSLETQHPKKKFPSKGSLSVGYTNSNLFFMELIHQMNGGDTINMKTKEYNSVHCSQPRKRRGERCVLNCLFLGLLGGLKVWVSVRRERDGEW